MVSIDQSKLLGLSYGSLVEEELLKELHRAKIKLSGEHTQQIAIQCCLHCQNRQQWPGQVSILLCTHDEKVLAGMRSATMVLSRE